MERCNICKKQETETHCEAMPGLKVYVCNVCLEKAKHNFIFICINCGKSYFRSKKTVIKRLKDKELKGAYALCKDEQIIQGIDMCIECDPVGVVDAMEPQGRC